MVRIFISYCRVDRPFVRELASRLQRIYGKDAIWFDEELHGGEVWWQTILDQINVCNIFMYLLTPESIDSAHCWAELAEARRLNKQILPVVIRSRTPIPPNLDHIQVPDMSAGITVDSLTELQVAITFLSSHLPVQTPKPLSSQPTPKPVVFRATRKYPKHHWFWVIGLVAVVAFGVLFLLLNDRKDNSDPQTTPGTPTQVLVADSAETLTRTSEPANTDAPVPTDTPTPEPTVTDTGISNNTPTATDAPTPMSIPAGSPNRNWTPIPEEFNGIKIVYVPVGCFMMGSEDGDDDEKPVHEVCLSGFWIGQTEVTNAQYKACVEVGTCDPPEDRRYFYDSAYADHPVVSVDWDQANTYAMWIGGSLPTEAQWEYAARGPEGWTYPWGDSGPTCEQANTYKCVGSTAPVAERLIGASWVGALDMSGNVWEWVADWYGSYSDEKLHDPAGPTSGDKRVCRGGAWSRNTGVARAAFRNLFVPSLWNIFVGFRVVMDRPAPQ